MEKLEVRKVNKTLEIPALIFRANFSPETINEQDRTVELRWTTGAKVRRGGLWSDPFNEELSLNPQHVRLERMNSGAPLLNSHSAQKLSDQIGVVVDGSVRMGPDGGFATVRFSARDDVEPIFQDVKAGIHRNVSVGYRVHRYEDVTENDDKIKTFRAVDWEPMELSIVAIGADAGATVRSVEEKNECTFTITEKEKSMAAPKIEENKTQTEKAVEINADQVRKEAAEQAVQAERVRVSEINTLVRKHNLSNDLSAKFINDGLSIEDVRKSVLDELERKSETNQIRSQVQVGRDISVESRRDGMSDALLCRADPSRKMSDVAKEYRGMSLIDMGREAIEAAGGKSRGLSKREIAVAALNLDHSVIHRAGMQATSDFPEILANTVNRSLRAAYESAPRTFVPWCRKATAPDFKQIARAALSEASAFSAIPQGGEYKAVSFSDGAEKYSLGKHGGIVRVTWESLVNDDMDAFGRLPIALAEEGAATEGDVVYAILSANAAMADNVALFNSGHANYTSSGTDISDTSLGVGRALMRKQTGPKGRKLNITPAFLIVGPDKESVANKYTSAMYVASSPGNINPSFNTSLTVIVDPRISGNKWYLAANPGRIDTIEYAYLEGEEGIFTEQRMGWEVDGLEVKARLVFAAKAIDYRSMYYNVGA